MATTSKTTSKTAPTRPQPQDRLPKKSAVEKAAREALEGEFTIDIDGAEFTVADPMDWSPDASTALMTGNWLMWARTALVDAEDVIVDFAEALRNTTNRGINSIRQEIVERHATAMGEGLSSPRS